MGLKALFGQSATHAVVVSVSVALHAPLFLADPPSEKRNRAAHPVEFSLHRAVSPTPPPPKPAKVALHPAPRAEPVRAAPEPAPVVEAAAAPIDQTAAAETPVASMSITTVIEGVGGVGITPGVTLTSGLGPVGAGSLGVAETRSNAIGRSQDVAAYRRAAQTKLHRALRYPERARRKGLAGTVWVVVVLGNDGRVLDAHVDGEAHELLADAALAAVQAAAPFPAPPDGALTLRVPFAFELR